jgi:hypothetical protein
MTPKNYACEAVVGMEIYPDLDMRTHQGLDGIPLLSEFERLLSYMSSSHPELARMLGSFLSRQSYNVRHKHTI